MGLTVHKPIACALRRKSDLPQSRAALFDPPTNPVAIVAALLIPSEDLALIHEPRRAANQLGFGIDGASPS